MKRLFLLAAGIGLGATVGAVVTRRIDRAARAAHPANLAAKAGRTAAELGGRLRAAWEETRAAAAEHEAELRTRFDIPDAADLVRRD